MHRKKNMKIVKMIYFLVYLIFGSLPAQSGMQLEKVVFAIEAGLFQEALNQLDIAQLKEPNYPSFNLEFNRITDYMYVFSRITFFS